MRPYRDDDNEQFRRGWQRRWQDDMQGSRPRRSQGYGEDRYPGDRYGSSERYGSNERYGSSERYGSEPRYGSNERDVSERERERYGNPLERHPYEEPWRMGGPYRLRQGGYDEEGYRVPSYSEGYESDLGRSSSGFGNYRNPYGDSSRGGYSSEHSGRYGSQGSQQWDRQGSSSSGTYGYGYDQRGTYGSDQRRGPYRGRGPKGYRRSDETIRDDVSRCLEEHGMIDASEIEVSVKEGVVTLKGSVDQRESKRLAEDLVGDVHGVKDVENQIRVDSGFFDRESSRQSKSGSGLGTEKDSSRQV